MVKNLNNVLLDFMQGSSIQEKDMSIPQFYGKQKLKLIWKDMVGMIKKMLANSQFKDNLHDDPVIEKSVKNFNASNSCNKF